jgi:DNA processing protein
MHHFAPFGGIFLLLCRAKMTDHSNHRAYWWLALGKVPGVGLLTYHRLLERFGRPEAVFQAPPEALRTVDRLGARLAQEIGAFDHASVLNTELSRLDALNVRVITLEDPEYPPLLAQILQPPPYLYVKGALGAGANPVVAVVGSRAASVYGLRVAYRLARELAACGMIVISGMARGVDAEAHKGALAGGGKTIAVLGSGINVIYPPENRRLYTRIVAQGAVISEFALDAEPDAGHFPLRNRIISGMSIGVVIVEAAPNSGSLITARLALEQGREVFAVPGSVDSVRSRGTHHLLRQGACLVESAEDIVNELSGVLQRWELYRPARPQESDEEPGLSVEERRLLTLLQGEDPVHIDELIRRGKVTPAAANAVLLQLELKGKIRQLSGKFFVRV